MLAMVAAPLKVSRKQRAELDRMARSTSLPHRCVVRAKGRLLAADGMANEAIARECSTTSDTVRRWRAKFEQGGVEAVGTIAAGRGRRPEIPQVKRPQLGLACETGRVSTTADTAPRTGRHADTGRRGPPTRGQKHASARSGRCPTHRRGPRAAFPQVTSDARPDSARRSVGSMSYYDPTTGNFTSLDPLVALTEEPYGYTGGNPANYADPSGQFRIPGTDWCVDIADPNCNSIAEQHPEVAQGVADFSGGVLNGLSMGTASNVGFVNDRVNFESGWAMGGHVAGGLVLLPFAVNAAPAFFYVSTAAGFGNTGYTCYQSGLSMNCAVSASFAVGNFYLPGMGAELAAFRGLPSALRMNSLATWSWLLNLKGGVETSAVEQAGC